MPGEREAARRGRERGRQGARWKVARKREGREVERYGAKGSHNARRMSKTDRLGDRQTGRQTYRSMEILTD